MDKRQIEKMKRRMYEMRKSEYDFPLCYHDYAFVSGFNCDTVIDAIKKFNSCFNSYISMIYDKKNDKFYFTTQNKQPDARGNRNMSYFDITTKELLFNEDELTKPIVKITPAFLSKDSAHGYIDLKGNYFQCGFEGHIWLAKELFLSNTTELTEDEKTNFRTTYARDLDTILEGRGWIKLSDYSIRAFRRGEKAITREQKQAIEDFLILAEKRNYEFNGRIMSMSAILDEIKGIPIV